MKSVSATDRSRVVQPRVLVVDDEPDIRELIRLTLTRMQVDCLEAATLAEALQLLDQQGQGRIQLCLTDMRLPDGNGMDLIYRIQKYYSHIPVAMITAHGNMSSAIEALKAGAFDFLNKPVELQTLRNLVTSAVRLEKQQQIAPGCDPGPELMGQSRAIEKIRALVVRLSRSLAPVHISGESGTGKELVARMLHHRSHRCDKPFIAVNCGAIPADLMESEFFGHRKGSFTGATQHKEGLFQAAEGGTLFLDEVADLPLDMQVKLLRAIQEKSVRPVGAQKEEFVDVRIVSATHEDLAAKVESGEFREDLYYRINVIELRVPPLREHAEDIPYLAAYFLQQLATEMGRSAPRLSAEAQERLCRHRFPGNVRELENVLARAITLNEGDLIEIEDIQLDNRSQSACDEATAGANGLQKVCSMGLEAYLELVERQILQEALEATHFNKTAAARKLGITFRTLRYRLKKLEMD
ncbi:sigma-54-dependent transcriptional regulator [Nitrincola iocasae]|uniref:Sigma-54-dependent Fis family transcriptional regulator n=1 Tax=Nitrincola iocasae TaxID=2614693 RepID=A0A5J6LE68_9GAMM|nr:sigma-54 dependent transcriptional regulator [Nitrincola iocasae]QEW06807.1 sigma-54-dependent Fis family transcriptional regulator [Nitrincola iocasae]